MKIKILLASHFTLAALGTTFFASCGGVDFHTDSSAQFVRGSARQNAVLEERDFKDSFFFGVNVIDSKNFFSKAYALDYKPRVVHLEYIKETTPSKVNIVAESGSKSVVLMSFDAKKNARGQVEVDFSSPGNELRVYDGLGADATGGSASGGPSVWQSSGRPNLVHISQTPDVVVADIAQNVTYSLKKYPTAGGASRKSGSVTFRIFLKRTEQSDVMQRHLTVEEGEAKNIGFLSSDIAPGSRKGNIARYKVDVNSRKEGQIIVYLKDFPAEFYPVGESAILAWNKAFGFKAIVVKPATAEVDIGDPRYNVVRWLDGLDEDVAWVGHASTQLDPRSGNVISAQILINGSSSLKLIIERTKYTSDTRSGFAGFHGKIGNVPIIESAGEIPVTTFTTNPNMDLKTFSHGYYSETIMHEFGHSLGLGHNFAASTLLDNGQSSSSVMDYAPDWSEARVTSIGSYDMAAIRWGYFGEAPKTQLAYCTDQDVFSRVDCNKTDLGDPVKYTLATLMNGTAALERIAVPLPNLVITPMKNTIETAFKFLRLRAQLPKSEREQDLEQLMEALDRVENSKPVGNLTGAERAIVNNNLARLHRSYSEVMDSHSHSASLR